MGSPLSPILAEVFLNNLEVEYISQNTLFRTHILEWRRYVDDVFVIFKGSIADIDRFVGFLNTIHPNISFTSEVEHNHTLPFLDLNISNLNNCLSFEIYRKPTHTDHTIPFSSTHPVQHKLAAFRSMLQRMHKVPMTDIAIRKEFAIIGYSLESFII